MREDSQPISEVETQIIGNGPTAFGFPTAVLQAGDSFTNHSVTIIGPRANLGAGSLGYNIHSNSGAEDFLSVKEDLPGFADAENASQLALARGNSVDLNVVAGCEREYANAILDVIVEQQDQPVYIDDMVYKIQVDQDGQIVTSNIDGEALVKSKNVIVANGAAQNFLPGITDNSKVVLSDDFLRLPLETIKEDFKGKKIVIIGGAHSAFSALDNLRRSGLEDNQISVIHRSEVKLFFPNAETANEVGYFFTYHDLDEGKVHRFTGVRGAAKERYLRVSRGEENNTKLIHDIYQNQRSVLAEADVIIQAVGYRPKRIPIFNNGQEIPYSGCDFEENFKPLEAGNGKIFFNGIGVTARDGVNLFQGEFSRRIYEQIKV